MQLKEDEIREFSALWQQKFGEAIPPAVARQRATELLELYHLLAQPLGPTRMGDSQPSQHEVLSLLPKIKRGRGSSGPLH
ncbi:MAG: hypothetical protein A2583_02755 [Bdellovibrionales bacterium RIFOXYD1_FULL_53_11]|nr:MAG: hypothetical protein A2583_02755 [Bdellovibrionales bacterium RIFOXYD1_FULL_53_11]